MARTYRQSTRRSLVCSVPSLTAWRYHLGDFQIIETPKADRVGLLSHLDMGHSLRTTSLYELKPGVNWLAVTPSVLRYLSTLGEEWLGFELGTGHPAYGCQTGRWSASLSITRRRLAPSASITYSVRPPSRSE